ncbi:MAG TPA: hypothetical protein DCW90_17135 [Lachnospiraceae bacterium]|nr:hypothetical protein [Lachnospiraceae bacterium]
MADFENIEPDEYKYLGQNYNSGRPWGIKYITIHHMAGDFDADTCNRIWRGAGTSAHYSIDRNGYIVQHVDDGDRAWACGDGLGWGSGGNDCSISIEHANNNSNPWTVYDAAIESGAHLTAALCKAYGLGRPEWDVNVMPHQHWSSTACLPIKTTELLTKNGWKLLKDIEVGEEVASAVMDDLSIVWCPVKRVVPVYKTHCWMSRDLEATSDHRILAKAYNDTEVVKQWKEICGCTSKNATSTYWIPNAGFMYGDGLDITDSELELIVAVQADGHYSRDSRRDNAIENVRFHFAKQRKLDRLFDLLDDTGFEYSYNLKKDGTHDVIVNKSLYDFVEQYLDNKHFTIEFGLGMNKHQRELFLDRILDWDGCRAGNDYSSSLKENIDVVQMVAALSGVGTKLQEDGKRLHFKKQYRTVSNSGAKRTYDKEVSCVTVDTGFILIRQHGRTTIVGNCPGELYGSQKEQYIQRAQEWYDAMCNGTEAAPAPVENNTSEPEYTPTPSSDIPSLRYRAYTQNQGWLPEMIDRRDTGGSSDDFAGDGSPITYLAIDMPGWYQVKTVNNGWLPQVYAYDCNDFENGCAGDGSPITAVRCYYETQNPNSTGWLKIRYAVNDLPEMEDTTDTGGSSDDFAGNGNYVTKFYAYLTR